MGRNDKKRGLAFFGVVVVIVTSVKIHIHIHKKGVSTEFRATKG